MPQVGGVHTGQWHLLTEETMADGPSPTVRRRQLGMELRRLREAADKSQDAAGQWVGVPSTTISKLETGKQRVTLPYLKLLLQLYDVGSPHSEALERLARESGQRGWWADYGNTVPSWFADYVGMETAAAEVWTYESEFVPGLLQTPQYIEAITVAMDHSVDTEIQRIINVRRTRQERLSADDPLTLRAVINEAVLRRVVGGTDVMSGQLKQLAEVAELPNVTVQVIPFSAGAHPGMLGSFTALRFPEEPMNTVYVELSGGAIYLERPAEAQRYAETFDRLAGLALTEKETVTFLHRMDREL
jgi:DNA-binding XRE family transcriptional regulator